MNMITPTGEEPKTTVHRIACCAYLKSSSTSAMPAAKCHMPHGVGCTVKLEVATVGHLVATS